MRTLLLLTMSIALPLAAPEAKTVNILMEGVPDTRYVQELLPEFKAKTGIDVQVEVVNYAEMHTKLVPQLVAQKGCYDAIVVDFYWVGEFTKAGWLQPLDDRIEDGQGRHLRLRPGADGPGRPVDGVTYMLPFYNYAMGLTYRKDMLEDPKHQAGVQGQVRHGPEGADGRGTST